ncbi:hypothetical protein MTR67_012484 [Solanum verrucosum]|uniref:Uncharacterized protein n=1 Tax=Solanum verrucosum TaxID=315347 RepID=A0AAF0QFS3_SOLVR|nr:hypothetical protein MTR67_012484 [Solanum verrucosum]
MNENLQKYIQATEKKIKENSIPIARRFESFVTGFELLSEFLLWWSFLALFLAVSSILWSHLGVVLRNSFNLLFIGEEIVAGDVIYGGSDRLLSQVVPKAGIGSSSSTEKNYELPEGQVITIGAERLCCPEALFQPSMIGIEAAAPRQPHRAMLDIRASDIHLQGVYRMSKEITVFTPSSMKIKVVSPPESVLNYKWLKKWHLKLRKIIFYESRFLPGKKFAKLALKSCICIEEFEEKLNKFDIERKEQELTAKNAQSHQQKVEKLESITVTEKEEEEIDESEITKGEEMVAEDVIYGSSDRLLSQVVPKAGIGLT